MMNVLAICLVVTSLFAAEVWSPNPTKQRNQQEEDVIVKEGHRVIVVETYDDVGGQHSTKISISPELEQRQQQQLKQEEEVEEKASAKQEKGQYSPGEVICDAFGKCKRKIASVLGRAEEKIAEAGPKEMAQEAFEWEARKAQDAERAIEDVYGKAKDTASQEARHDKEGAQQVYGKTKESVMQKAADLRDSVQESITEAKESAKQKVEHVKESAKDSLTKARDAAMEKAHEFEEGAKESLTKAKESAMEKAHELKDGAKEAKDLGKTIRVDVAKKVTKHGLWHLAMPDLLSSLISVAHLAGFSTAYGTCMWITFMSSYVLSGALPHQQFGMVQSKIYLVYFRAMALCIGLALLGHLAKNRRWLLTSKAEILQVYILLASLLVVIANAVYLEPLATKVMFKRIKIEKEEGRGRESVLVAETERTGASTESSAPAQASRGQEEEYRSRIATLNGQLKKLNSISSFLNIMSLIALTWHLFYISQLVLVVC